jgi:hypothetical protein
VPDRAGPGPPLILAAAVREQLLVVHPAAIVARLLATHYAELLIQPSSDNLGGDSGRADGSGGDYVD